MKLAARTRRTTARRIIGAFAIILFLFGAALLAVLIALRQIGTAEDEVARLDHAKHAGGPARGHGAREPAPSAEALRRAVRGVQAALTIAGQVPRAGSAG